jgi:hypothetical protein
MNHREKARQRGWQKLRLIQAAADAALTADPAAGGDADPVLDSIVELVLLDDGAQLERLMERLTSTATKD